MLRCLSGNVAIRFSKLPYTGQCCRIVEKRILCREVHEFVPRSWRPNFFAGWFLAHSDRTNCGLIAGRLRADSEMTPVRLRNILRQKLGRLRADPEQTPGPFRTDSGLTAGPSQTDSVPTAAHSRTDFGPDIYLTNSLTSQD